MTQVAALSGAASSQTSSPAPAGATRPNQSTGHPPILLTPAQAAKQVFGVSERKFHEMRHQAWMPKAVVLGPRIVRFIRAELEAACASMPRGSHAEPAQLLKGRVARLKASSIDPK